MSNKKIFFKSLTISLIIFSLISVSILYFITKKESKTINKIINNAPIKIEEDHNISILLITVKNRASYPNSFTLINLNAIENKINILPIPYKLESTVNVKTDNLKGFYDYGGSNMVVKAIENKFDINIKKYIRLDIENIINIIDMFGGIDVTLEKDINYLDPTTEKYISIQKGKVLLDGNMIVNMLYQNIFLKDNLNSYKQLSILLKEFIKNALNKIDQNKLHALYKDIINIIDSNISLYDYIYREEIIKNMILKEKPQIEIISLEGEFSEDKFKIYNYSKEHIKNIFSNYN